MEDRANTTLDDENRLVDLRPQVKRPVVEPGVETNKWSFTTLLLLLLLGSGLSRQRPLCIVNLQWQRYLGLDLDEQLLDVDLVVLDGGALDGLGSLLDQTSDDDCAFGADGTAELDHLLAELVTGGNDSLDGAQVLAQVKESQLRRLNTSVLNPAAEGDLLVNIVGDGVEADASDARGLEVLRASEGELAV